MEVIVILTVFCIGLSVGTLLARLKRRPVGTLRVDSSDPDGPYLFLELDIAPERVKYREYISLKVDTKSYTQK